MNRSLLALVMVLLSLLAYTQTLTELQTFRGSDTPNGSGNGDNFGQEIALHGNTVVVSAPAHNNRSGAVYVFELNGNNQWIEVAKLTASDAAIDQAFGHSVAIENNVIIVGAPGFNRTDQGVYIFEKPGSGWTNMTETIKLNTPYTGSSLSGFGFSVDIQNDEILIGAPYEDNGALGSAGRIYIYEKSGVSWTTAFVRAELTTTNVGNGDLIGYSAVFGHDFIVTGASTGSFAGTLHVFEKPTTGVWSNATAEDIILFGSDRSSLDSFGGVVSAAGNLIVSAGFFDGNIDSDMNVYLFEREGILWSDQSSQNEAEIYRLPSYFPYQGFQNSFLTISLETQSNLLFIGNGLSTGPSEQNFSGSVFIRNSKTGSLLTEIDGLDFAPTGAFGSAIAIDGSRLIISSPEETIGGVVRFFDLSYNLSISRQLCSGESIAFGSQTITGSGTYQELFTSEDGLDSLVTLTVTTSTLSISTSKTDNFCFGESNGEINVGGNGGLAPYEYSLDGITYGSSPTFPFLLAGSYTTYVRDANGCVVSEVVEIEEPNELVIDNVIVSDPECNQGEGFFTIVASGGTPIYEYSADGINYANASNLGQTFPAGSYTLYVRDAAGCITTTNATISEPAALDFNVSISDASCFGASDGSIVATGAVGGNGSPYSYSIDGTNFSAAGDFQNLSEGNYTITLQDGNSCVVTKEVTVAAPAPLALATTASNTSSCGLSDGTIVSSVTGGTAPYTYSLNNGSPQTSETFSGLSAGNYTITIVDANGCLIDETVSINDPVTATVTTVVSDISCNGEATGSIEVVVAGGTAPIEYSFEGGVFQSNNVFDDLSAGTYDVTIREANGCTQTVTGSVAEPTAIVATLSKTDLSCNGDASGEISIVASGGTGALEFSLDDITYQSASTFNGLSAGSYDVFVKDENGCILASSTTLDEPIELVATTSVTNASCSGSLDGSVLVSASGGTAPYSYALAGAASQSSNLFEGMNSGTYLIEVIDANNCVYEISNVLVENDITITVTVSETDAVCNGDANGGLSISAAGGAAPYQYSIDGGSFQSSGTFGMLSAGSYELVAKDQNNCSVATTIVIDEPDELIISVVQSNRDFTVSAAGGTAPYEYSIDGVNFQANGTFNNLDPGNYVFTVRDANGCVDDSESFDIVLSLSPSLVEIYPNPVADFITIRGIEFETVVIYAMDGKEVLRSGSSTIDVSELGDGMYALKLYKKRKEIHRHRIIKN